jgi:hypothetical protein
MFKLGGPCVRSILTLTYRLLGTSEIVFPHPLHRRKHHAVKTIAIERKLRSPSVSKDLVHVRWVIAAKIPYVASESPFKLRVSITQLGTRLLA